MAVAPSFVPKPTSRRGVSRTSDNNDMIAALTQDVFELTTHTNVNEVGIKDLSRLLFNEFMNARNTAVRAIEATRAAHVTAAIAGETIHNFIDLRTFRGPDYYICFEGLPTQRRARIEPTYGQAILPYNMYAERMYAVDPETNAVVIPENLAFDIGDECGSAEVEEGTFRNALNGNNRDYWIRKYTMPIHEDMDSVAATIDITLPRSLIERCNMINLHPAPLGQLDIEELKYSTTAAVPTTDLPGFTPLRCTGFSRWHFQDTAITRLRIKIRQRNFIEEDGKKVFYLGLQEIGVRLISFDKTIGETQPTDNNGFIAVAETPEGYTFDLLKRLVSSPTYSTGLVDHGISIRIYTDAALTNLVWNSGISPRLSDTNVDVSALAVNKLYLLVTLQYIGALNVSPLLDNIVFGYTVR